MWSLFMLVVHTHLVGVLHVELVLAIAHFEMLRKTTKKMGTKNTASTVPRPCRQSRLYQWSAGWPSLHLQKWPTAARPA